ncbi:ThiF family adenylyltransferase [Cellulomonas iranensis]|uniref:Bacteriocin biosynthesis cyclodehydratase domain-containing protein n=1 Tax=Cellulomonas iranensis TaxID=76862 RepID=A0ABU0GP75_9CELL|nr:ThiF family adenylyltransferase [Cellulomonas iranensis]MDQ0426400.1 bacteriocin biosynthesis cyclodehydratase domain-containing protein [Cellulomonas iranensis]
MRRPAPLQLRPGLPVLPRGDREVQVGLDPRWAVRLVDLPPAEAALWSTVDATTDLTALPARAGDAGADPASVAATVDDLRRAGLTRVPPPGPGTAGPAGADARAWSLLAVDGGGDAVVARRADAVAGVVGLGPTGLGVARHLAVAGVGTLLLDDDAPVSPADVAGTHRWSDVGTPRALAAARALRDAVPGVRVDGDAEPDVVVVVEHHAADPGRAMLLMSAQVPHVPVVVRDADAIVGPVVRPGLDPCLRCLDLHRTDVDPAWPTVLRSLTSARAPAVTEVGVLAGAAAALAAAQVLALLAGTVPALCSASVELALPDLVARERRWATHPACGCVTPPGTTDAGPREA